MVPRVCARAKVKKKKLLLFRLRSLPFTVTAYKPEY